MDQAPTQPQTGADTAPDTSKLWELYADEIDNYVREFQAWNDRAKKIERLYADKNNTDSENAPKGGKFSMLWSNVQTLLPALYGRDPTVLAERRFRDADPVGRVASMLLERGTSIQLTEYEFGPQVMRPSVLDRLLGGRGVAWIRHEPQKNENGQTVYETAPCDYLPRSDFFHSSRARKWDEVWWVGRRAYMTRQELIDRFGPQLGVQIPLDHKIEDRRGVPSDEEKAEIYEIWSKRDRAVIWLSKSYKLGVLDVQKPFADFRDFFPCPRPVYSSLEPNTLIPVPDYVYYQDQASALDDMEGRVIALTDALRVAGVYDASTKQDLSRLFKEDGLISVDSWAALMEKGGLKGVIQVLPIAEIAQTLNELYKAIESQKQVIYEITGISDIVRGQSVASETLGAQQIKNQYATLRLSDMQKDVARYARDLTRLKAEVVAEVFAPETIALMAGLDMQDPQVAAVMPKALALLRNDALRTFKVDIETDSTIAIDDDAEKKARTEFLQEVGQFLTAMTPVVQAVPELMPLVGDMLLFGARGFRAGRQLEGSIEAVMATLKQKAQQPPPQPQPDAAMADVQRKAQEGQANLQLKAQQVHGNLAIQAAKASHSHPLIKAAAQALVQQNAPQPPMSPQPQPQGPVQ